MLKSGVCSVTLRQLSAAEIIKLTVEAGLDGIEWGGDIHVPAGDIATAESVGRMTREAGLCVTGYGSYFRCDDAAAIAPLAASARALQAPSIRVWTGRKSRSDISSGELDSLVKVIRLLCDAVPEMSINSEFHNNTFTDDAEGVLELIERVDRSNFKTGFQLYQHLDNLNNAKLFKPYLGNVHVYNYDHAPLSECAGLWHQLIAEFADQDRALLLEFVQDNAPENFLRDAAVLRQLLAEYK